MFKVEPDAETSVIFFSVVVSLCEHLVTYYIVQS